MSRPARVWLAFGLCAALAAAALGLVTWFALSLDRAEAEVRRRAAFEENVRLALWRMESTLAPLVARESARPPATFSAFYTFDRALPSKSKSAKPGLVAVLAPSPLLASAGNGVRLHFQIGADGKMISPQAPDGAWRETALANVCAAREDLEAAGQKLARLSALLDRTALVAALPAGGRLRRIAMVQDQNKNLPAFPPHLQPSAQIALNNDNDAPNQPAAQPQGQQGGQTLNPREIVEQQSLAQSSRNVGEYNRRRDYQQKQQADNWINANPEAVSSSRLNSSAPQSAKPPAGNQPPAQAEGDSNRLTNEILLESNETLMQPLWFGSELVLARRTTLEDGSEAVQGCWLDWPGLKRQLLGDIRDLLPAADLAPVRLVDSNHERMLAALPVRLAPGPAAGLPDQGLSPMKLSLLAAWGGMLAAAAAVGSLLAGAISLSERRGAFVSAVTHELRSPLTTFRMYTEMLSEGMVRGEERRGEYLATLRAEADRLGHLVENVLAYSRLENSGHAGRPERLPVGKLLERAAERSARRAQQSGMSLVIEGAGEAAELAVRADPAAVEQILFNLVDNACKYAAGAEDRRVLLAVARAGRFVALRVRDFGPGVSPDAAGKLFRPFSRSAGEAAGSAPGVGLGLALSRRLARQMGGELRLEPADGRGACFALRLPVA